MGEGGVPGVMPLHADGQGTSGAQRRGLRGGAVVTWKKKKEIDGMVNAVSARVLLPAEHPDSAASSCGDAAGPRTAGLARRSLGALFKEKDSKL